MPNHAAIGLRPTDMNKLTAAVEKDAVMLTKPPDFKKQASSVVGLHDKPNRKSTDLHGYGLDFVADMKETGASSSSEVRVHALITLKDAGDADALLEKSKIVVAASRQEVVS